MEKKLKVVFLYTEIAEYFLACIHELAKKNAEIHIFRWSVNNEAPFKFRNLESVKFYERKDFNDQVLQNKINELNPDIILTSGWIDKGYLKIVKNFRKTIPVVLCLDNQWTGSIKQQIASITGKFFIDKHFSHAWVAGERQEVYAKKLGFKNDKIKQGFYSADFELYDNYYLQTFENKKLNFPRNFIFVGRYIDSKGIFNLWEAFIDFQNEMPNDSELICIGTGELFDQKITHPKIKHLGFVQPSEIGAILSQTGIFVLPSKFEPWGVVVHEFAIAGYPIICSDKVGAATKFVKDNQNGYIYDSNDKEALKELFKLMLKKTDPELIEMSQKSRELSLQITPGKWADTLIEIFNSK